MDRNAGNHQQDYNRTAVLASESVQDRAAWPKTRYRIDGETLTRNRLAPRHGQMADCQAEAVLLDRRHLAGIQSAEDSLAAARNLQRLVHPSLVHPSPAHPSLAHPSLARPMAAFGQLAGTSDLHDQSRLVAAQTWVWKMRNLYSGLQPYHQASDY